MTDEYVDVRELHPDYQRAPCRIDGCPRSKLVPASALVNREYTLCEEHAPDVDGLLGPRGVVRI
ncbi:hypothetical protein [Halorussus salinus]|uniref:hypothetical protein n=1 Tax=Halorussus salinus TaxID=1364935 RepID=UPI0010919648|nr:hypothetical protein [Halorussus salinus]